MGVPSTNLARWQPSLCGTPASPPTTWAPPPSMAPRLGCSTSSLQKENGSWPGHPTSARSPQTKSHSTRSRGNLPASTGKPAHSDQLDGSASTASLLTLYRRPGQTPAVDLARTARLSPRPHRSPHPRHHRRPHRSGHPVLGRQGIPRRRRPDQRPLPRQVAPRLTRATGGQPLPRLHLNPRRTRRFHPQDLATTAPTPLLHHTHHRSDQSRPRTTPGSVQCSALARSRW